VSLTTCLSEIYRALCTTVVVRSAVTSPKWSRR